MELALNEMKIQSKKLLKQFHANQIDSPMIQRQVARENIVNMQLKHALQIIANYYGFESWQQAHQVLSGNQTWFEGMSLGSLFYSRACEALTNHWFGDYVSALNMLNQLPTRHYLLPYKHQYLVVQPDYMALIMDLAPAEPMLRKLNFDLAKGYGSSAWDQLANSVLRHRARYRS